jgi:predicted nucleic acid-binding Zn ribbon protein
MRRSKTISIGEAMQDYIKEMNLGPKLKELSLIDSWENMVGKAISTRTSKVYIKDKILFVHLKSSIVRNELMMIREALREKLNTQAGEEVIKEIVLK